MTSKLQLRKEEEARRADAALSAMARARRLARGRRDLIHTIFASPDRPEWRALPEPVRGIAETCRLCCKDRSREALKWLVLHVERHADRLLEAPRPAAENSYLVALLRLARLHDRWLRPLETWRPTSRNASRQFGHLARHLLAHYPVPHFLDSLFFTPGTAQSDGWFYHLGTGGNLRTAPRLSAALTKRMAHHALQAPDDFQVMQAIRWGQVLGLGGDRRLARAVVATNLGRQLWDRRDEEWWLTVIHWFVNHPLLDPVHVGPIVDYAHYRRYEAEEPPGDFSMTGRSPAAVLRLVDEWHDEIHNRDRRLHHFQHCGARGGTWTTSWQGFTVGWQVQEILDSRALVEEGRSMRHCVATYLWSILNGKCSIWSLQVNRYGGWERALTIELDNASRTVLQCRGKCNRYPTPEERGLLAKWAEGSYLTLGFCE